MGSQRIQRRSPQNGRNRNGIDHSWNSRGRPRNNECEGSHGRCNFSIEKAVAVKKGRILRVGTDAEIESLIAKGTKVLNLGGKCILPRGLTIATGMRYG